MPTTPRHGAHDARRRKDEGASVWACTPTRTSGPASAPALQSALPKRPQRGGTRRALLYLVRTVLALAVVGGMAFGTYVLYLESHYTRIADNTLLEINQANATDVQPQLVAGQTYTATTYNIGFGAYTPDYTFFMDRGAMADGTATQGTSSVATGEQSVRDCTAGDIATMRAAAGGMAPDFMLFQEVDVDSDRSYHVDQRTALADAFPTYQSVFASNFHAGFLAWPPTSPHGRVSSGLLTLADVDVTSALRRSYPVDESFPTKFFDLDRCFEVLRVPVSDGRELVLINSHMSAYDEGGTVRARQLSMLGAVLSAERAAGNYVIAGGDWNHALCGSLELYPSQQQVPDWVATLDDEDLPEGFSVVRAGNLEEVASCRGDDIPYERDVTYTVTVDGFVVSDNVSATATNIDTGFATSDHNPVLLSFALGA